MVPNRASPNSKLRKPNGIPEKGLYTVPDIICAHISVLLLISSLFEYSVLSISVALLADVHMPLMGQKPQAALASAQRWSRQSRRVRTSGAGFPERKARWPEALSAARLEESFCD